MLSEAEARRIQRRYDIERGIARQRQRERRAALPKSLAKAIGVGLFAHITMVTGQMAGWIAITLIGWSLCHGAAALDKHMDWRWAPWQR